MIQRQWLITDRQAAVKAESERLGVSQNEAMRRLLDEAIDRREGKRRE